MKPLSLLTLATISVSAAAQVTFVETFDGANPAGWTFGSPNGFIQASGGNPGAFYRDTFLDTFAPQPRTTMGVSSAFTGDYRANQVLSVGIDLILFDVDFSAEGRPLSVLLVSDGGTPGNFDDDWAAYFMGTENVPLVGEGWKSYEFDIPSQSMSLPSGWGFVEFGPDASPDWNSVITNVSQLRFFYGNPVDFFIFQVWDLGMDNPRITAVPEPATLLFLSAGLAVLVRRPRRLKS